jgi:hypothetical protein
MHKQTWTARDTCALALAIVEAGDTVEVRAMLARLQMGTVTVQEAAAFLMAHAEGVRELDSSSATPPIPFGGDRRAR